MTSRYNRSGGPTTPSRRPIHGGHRLDLHYGGSGPAALVSSVAIGTPLGDMNRTASKQFETGPRDPEEMADTLARDALLATCLDPAPGQAVGDRAADAEDLGGLLNGQKVEFSLHNPPKGDSTLEQIAQGFDRIARLRSLCNAWDGDSS